MELIILQNRNANRMLMEKRKGKIPTGRPGRRR
jgi:hypothetical protein